jgi:hypothetical protein
MTKRFVAHHAIVPFAFQLQVSYRTQEYPPNSSRLNREYNRAPRGAAMSLCTSIPATRSYSTFIRAATSCSGNAQRTGTSAPPARAPDQYRRLTHAHAAATGLPGTGLRRQSNFRPRTVQAQPATTGGTPAQLCTLPSCPPPPDHRERPRPPATRTRQRPEGTQLSLPTAAPAPRANENLT